MVSRMISIILPNMATSLGAADVGLPCGVSVNHFAIGGARFTVEHKADQARPNMACPRIGGFECLEFPIGS